MDTTNILVLSLGTGAARQEEKYNATKASEWGLLNWVFDKGNYELGMMKDRGLKEPCEKAWKRGHTRLKSSLRTGKFPTPSYSTIGDLLSNTGSPLSMPTHVSPLFTKHGNVVIFEDCIDKTQLFRPVPTKNYLPIPEFQCLERRILLPHQTLEEKKASEN